MNRITSFPEQVSEGESGPISWLRSKLESVLRIFSENPESQTESVDMGGLFSRIYMTEPSDIDLLRQVLNTRPAVAEKMNDFMQPELTLEQASKIARQLNAECETKEGPAGNYRVISFRLPGGSSLRVKLWRDMKDSMNFDVEERISTPPPRKVTPLQSPSADPDEYSRPDNRAGRSGASDTDK